MRATGKKARAKRQRLAVDLASGRFDALSGRYRDVDWDRPATIDEQVQRA